MKKQFIIDEDGKKVGIILPTKEYQKMPEELVKLEDIRLYDSVKTVNEPFVPYETYVQKRKMKKNG